MSIIVRIPVPLQNFTRGESEIETPPGTVISIIDFLEQNYPGIRERITKDDELVKFVNFFVDEEDIRFLEGSETEVKDGGELSIVPAIARG